MYSTVLYLLVGTVSVFSPTPKGTTLSPFSRILALSIWSLSNIHAFLSVFYIRCYTCDVILKWDAATTGAARSPRGHRTSEECLATALFENFHCCFRPLSDPWLFRQLRVGDPIAAADKFQNKALRTIEELQFCSVGARTKKPYRGQDVDLQPNYFKSNCSRWRKLLLAKEMSTAYEKHFREFAFGTNYLRLSHVLDFSRIISLQHQLNVGIIMVEFPRIINYFTNTIENWVPIKACIKTFNYAFLSPGEAPCSST